jgi:glucose-1-phosphatase
MQNIKNIIFDLGNVILDIDTKLSKIAFERQGLKDFDNLYTLASQNKIFDKLEVGELNPDEFFKELRIIRGVNLSDEIIMRCWNALIMDYTTERLEILQNCKKEYRTFILSNTNIIHYQHYTDILKNKYNINGLESLVEKAYFSHEVKMKKPDAEIFLHILSDSKIEAEETLFIDDSKIHILAADKLGFQTIWLNEKKLEDLDIFG